MYSRGMAVDMEHSRNYSTNTSEESFQPETNGTSPTIPQIPQSEYLLSLFQWLVLLIGLVGTLANGSLLCILLSKHLRKRVANKLITNQVFLDLLSSILLVIAFALQLAKLELRDLQGLVVCVLFDSYNLVYMALAGSNVGLVMITLERYGVS